VIGTLTILVAGQIFVLIGFIATGPPASESLCDLQEGSTACLFAERPHPYLQAQTPNAATCHSLVQPYSFGWSNPNSDRLGHLEAICKS
jgi:hypothetical protein